MKKERKLHIAAASVGIAVLAHAALVGIMVRGEGYVAWWINLFTISAAFFGTYLATRLILSLLTEKDRS